MSAAPTMDLMPSNVIEAQIKRMEEDSWIIKGLRKQNERLKEELLNAQLEASVEIAKAKLGQAQAFQRMNAIENDLNNLRNWIQGNAVQRSEFEALQAQVNGVTAV